MLSLFWVLLVVVQPTVNAKRAMTLTMLNEVRICFIFVPVCLVFDLVSTAELQRAASHSPSGLREVMRTCRLSCTCAC
jgi:hypothetical protein